MGDERWTLSSATCFRGTTHGDRGDCATTNCAPALFLSNILCLLYGVHQALAPAASVKPYEAIADRFLIGWYPPSIALFLFGTASGILQPLTKLDVETQCIDAVCHTVCLLEVDLTRYPSNERKC